MPFFRDTTQLPTMTSESNLLEKLRLSLEQWLQAKSSQTLVSGQSLGTRLLVRHPQLFPIVPGNLLIMLNTSSDYSLQLTSIFTTELFSLTKLSAAALGVAVISNLQISTNLQISKLHTWIQLVQQLFNVHLLPQKTRPPARNKKRAIDGMITCACLMAASVVDFMCATSVQKVGTKDQIVPLCSEPALDINRFSPRSVRCHFLSLQPPRSLLLGVFKK